MQALTGTSNPGRVQDQSAARTARYWEVDVVRGVAIVMMVVYHLVYNLYFFQITDAIFTNPFWFYFQRATATTFILLVGVSLALYNQHLHENVRFTALPKRGVRIFAWGMLISIVTWFALGRDIYIRFGILHFIGVSIVIASPFLRFRWANLVLGIALIAIGIWLQQFRFESPWTYLFWLGFEPRNHNYVDFFPFIRWFGVVLIGIGFGNWFYGKDGRRIFLADISHWAPFSWLAGMGRQSLLIYLLHQPILFAILIPLLLLLGVVGVRF